MVEPNSKFEQLLAEYFVPDETLAVFFGTTSYDAVWEEKKDKEGKLIVKQAFEDINAAENDIKCLKECLYKYGVKSDKDIYNLNQPTDKDSKGVFRQLMNRVKAGSKGPKRRHYLIIYLFAGHGVLMDGMQAYVLNEWDPSNKYYKIFNAEKKVRALAESYYNTYNISIFACCRMLYNSKTMQGMMSLDEAKEHD